MQGCATLCNEHPTSYTLHVYVPYFGHLPNAGRMKEEIERL